MNIDLASLTAALGQVRSGNLRAATSTIQAALGSRKGAPASFASAASAGQAAPASPTGPGDVIDVTARFLTPEASDSSSTEPAARAEERSARAEPPANGRFLADSYSDGRDRRDYKLFVPPQAGDRPLPLVVMLHGCTQDPDDFAAGTGMNEMAAAQGFYVLYPAQSRQANPQGCWNWFKHSHQQRGRGEPALLAAMTRDVMQHHRIDAQRVFVAGLSAGGAMAAILGETHPDLYAAVGVHSGLAAGSALDLPSALSAMRGAGQHPAGAPTGVPTIVFHGDADATVHQRNGEHVIRACVDATATVEITAVNAAGMRSATRAIHRGADGAILAERWTIHGAPHAWSGGRTAGSYTDSRGPDASAELIRFFLEHPHPADRGTARAPWQNCA